MRPAGGSGKFTVATDVADGQVRVVVNALDKNDEFLNFLNMTGTAVGPGHEAACRCKIEQTAPGRYVGTFPASDAGSYFVMVSPGRGPGADPHRRQRALFRRVPRPRAERRAARATCRDRAQGRAGRQGDRGARATSSKAGAAAGGRSVPPRSAQGHEQPGRLALFAAGGQLPVLRRRVLSAACRCSFAWVPPLAGRVRDWVLRRQPKPAAPEFMRAAAEPQGRGVRPDRAAPRRGPLRDAARPKAGRSDGPRRPSAEPSDDQEAKPADARSLTRKSRKRKATPNDC